MKNNLAYLAYFSEDLSIDRYHLVALLPVHSEGDQRWDFFGRNDVKAETSVLCPPHAKS